MIINDDIFGCFGNSCDEIVLACTWPCLMYGELNQGAKNTTKMSFCGACTLYCVFSFCPFIPGMYLRITKGENYLEGCLSYACCYCCALLQDLRRSKVRLSDKNGRYEEY
jgi:hypothetical protein